MTTSKKPKPLIAKVQGNRILAQPKPLTDEMLFGSGSNGKRNGMLVRCRLYCAHCRNYFYAKPTKRPPYYVLNHQCSGDRRKQFVLGRHHRNSFSRLKMFLVD